MYHVVGYGVTRETETIGYDAMGASPRIAPRSSWQGSAYQADFGRALAGRWGRSFWWTWPTLLAWWRGPPSPVPHADFVTTTTHKT